MKWKIRIIWTRIFGLIINFNNKNILDVILIYENEGEILDNKRVGYGLYISKKYRSIYEGTWLNNIIYGKRTIII